MLRLPSFLEVCRHEYMLQSEIIKRPLMEILTLLLAVVMAAVMAIFGITMLCEILAEIIL